MTGSAVRGSGLAGSCLALLMAGGLLFVAAPIQADPGYSYPGFRPTSPAGRKATRYTGQNLRRSGPSYVPPGLYQYRPAQGKAADSGRQRLSGQPVQRPGFRPLAPAGERPGPSADRGPAPAAGFPGHRFRPLER